MISIRIRLMPALLAITALTMAAPPSFAFFFTKRPESLTALSKMSESQLDSIYRAGDVKGPIPHGDTNGYPILVTNDRGIESVVNGPVNDFVNQLWKGKIFTIESKGDKGTLVNKILFLKNTKADIFKAPSEFDGKPAIQLNYRHSEMAWARDIVDEIRKVKIQKPDGSFYPDLYLGRASLNGKFVCYFALQFPEQK